MTSAANVLEVRDLSVDFETTRGDVHALRHVSLAVAQRQFVGVVGESGSGKSTLSLAVMGLLPANAHTIGGRILFRGADILGMSRSELRDMRGRQMSIVFQDPMTSLHPLLSIGTQLIDIQYRDRRWGPSAKRRKAVDMLRAVGIPDPSERLRRYPHEFSGGMRQRIAIAMALMGNPELLIADEPTTALDVTMEAQIVHLLRELRREFDASILFISHNLGLIAELCDEVVILYAGEVVERGLVTEIFFDARHPYTQALLRCEPTGQRRTRGALSTIPGDVPNLRFEFRGCVFAPRCLQAVERCRSEAPAEHRQSGTHTSRCHFADQGQDAGCPC